MRNQRAVSHYRGKIKIKKCKSALIQSSAALEFNETQFSVGAYGLKSIGVD